MGPSLQPDQPGSNTSGRHWQRISYCMMQMLSVVTGIYSFFAVYYLSGLLTLFPVGLSLRLMGASTDTLWKGAHAVAFALSCVIAFYSSFPVARFVNRLFPVPANGTHRPGLMLICALSIALQFFFRNSSLRCDRMIYGSLVC